MTATEALFYGLNTTLWVSLLTLLALALRAPVTRRFGPRAAMLLWLMPALRLLAPAFPKAVTLPEEPALAEASAAPVDWQAYAALSAEETAMVTSALPPEDAVAVSSPSVFSFLTDQDVIAAFALSVWFAGAVVALSLCAARLVSWRKTLLAEADDLSAETEQLAVAMAERAGARRSFTLITIRAADTPQIMGLRHPLLALPKDFDTAYLADEKEMILLHELTHLKRGDLTIMAVSEIAFALQWFNPLTHHARRALRADQEAACDEAVRSLGINTKRYASLLLKSVSAGRSVPALTLDHSLKERIIRMQNPVGGPLKRKIFALTAAVSALAVAGFTASRTEVIIEETSIEDAQDRSSRGRGDDRARNRTTGVQKVTLSADDDAIDLYIEEDGTVLNDDDFAAFKDETGIQMDFYPSEPGKLKFDLDTYGADVSVGKPEPAAAEEAGSVSTAMRSAREAFRDAAREQREEARIQREEARRQRDTFEERTEDDRYVVINGEPRELQIFNVEDDKGKATRGFALIRPGEDADIRVAFNDEELQALRKIRVASAAEVEDLLAGFEALGKLSALKKGQLVFANPDVSPRVVQIQTGSRKYNWRHNGETSMVLLNDPFKGLAEMRPKEPKAVRPAPPKPVKPAERVDEDGNRWVRVPAAPDMSEFEAAMEAWSEEMEEWGEKMGEWGEKMGAAGEAIGELADRCEDHREESDKPIILEERVEDSRERVRAVCVSGGKERFESRELTEFLKRNRVSDDEMAYFRRQVRDL
jgi:beta-lactamase regulating signal transducer with metallopeptidase domain